MSEQASHIIRNIVAVIAGVVVGVALIMAVQMLGHQVYPVGEIDPNDREAMAALVASLPVGALLFVIASYAAGSFGGGAAAAGIGRGPRMKPALVVGLVLLLFGIMNLVSIPHPFWFSALTVLVFIPAAWLGARMVLARTASEAATG